MLAVHLAGVAARVLAVLAVEHRADGAVDTADRLVGNAVHAVDRRLGRVTDSVLRAGNTRGGNVVGTVEAGGENIARRAKEAANGAVDGRQNSRTVLARHVAAGVSATTLAVRLAGVLAVHLA